MDWFLLLLEWAQERLIEMKKLTLWIGIAAGAVLMPAAAGMPGNFMTEAVGARARGMGGAFTVVADDATAQVK